MTYIWLENFCGNRSEYDAFWVRLNWSFWCKFDHTYCPCVFAHKIFNEAVKLDVWNMNTTPKKSQKGFCCVYLLPLFFWVRIQPWIKAVEMPTLTRNFQKLAPRLTWENKSTAHSCAWISFMFSNHTERCPDSGHQHTGPDGLLPEDSADLDSMRLLLYLSGSLGHQTASKVDCARMGQNQLAQLYKSGNYRSVYLKTLLKSKNDFEV